jgi:hypothetical protein
MATSAAAIFILRRREKSSPTSSLGSEYSSITPVVAVFFILAYVAIATGVFLKDPVAAWTGTGLLGFFLLIFRVFYYKKAS